MFRNPVCGVVSVRQVLEYAEIEIHGRKQDGEAEYIWLDWLTYGWNRGNRMFYVYLCTFVNSLRENPTISNKETAK